MFDAIPSNLIQQAVYIGFYLLMAIFVLASTMAVYSLVRYGKNKFLVTVVCSSYIVIAVVLFFIAQNQLHKINLTNA